MPYIHGFLAAVPSANRTAFVDHATRAAALFREAGAIAVRECWEEDVPDGEVTSFPLAVKRKEGEAVVFSWIEWPDRETADACFAAMERGDDPRWAEMSEMPFDGKRMIWGGFTPVVEA